MPNAWYNNSMSELEKLKSELKQLNLECAKIKTLPPEERGKFGREMNLKKQQLLLAITKAEEAAESENVLPIDISAPAAPNQPLPELYLGSEHPLSLELERVVQIYADMGFNVVESCQLDDEFHMFDSLNFPKEHPARDGYDTFRTSENYIPPAHTSTMQHRVLLKYKPELEKGGEIAVVVPGRVFRNEDADATHGHTFHQCEGVFVSKTANMGQLFGILKRFFELYYGQKLELKTQPGFFPFTEPSAEYLIEKPASLGGEGWLEMGGCGMIHPNVLKTAGIDPIKYHGFAWGGGIDRLALLKYGLNDVRLFESGKLDFLEEF